MIKSIFTALLLGSALMAASAQTLTVDYLDGSVDLKTKAGDWQPLDEGAKLTSESVVRLKAGVLELSSGSLKFHLVKDGTYQISSVLSRKVPAGAQNVAVIVGDKLSKLLGTETNGRVATANAGVRAGEAPTETLEWVDDQPGPETIDSLVTRQDWPQALKAVTAALADRPEDPKSLLFTKARILAAQGRAAGALLSLNTADLKKGEARFVEAALLYASQGLEAQEYDLVLVKTADALLTVQDPELVQTLTLSQALAYQGLGKPAEAKTKLQAVVALGTTTAVGAEAKKLLGK